MKIIIITVLLTTTLLVGAVLVFLEPTLRTEYR
jgi:hypothetical protein